MSSAQGPELPTDRRVLLLLHPPGMGRSEVEGLAGALRVQVAPDWAVRLVRAEETSTEMPLQAPEALELAEHQGADAVVWIEPAPEPPGQVLYLVSKKDPESRAVHAGEVQAFDRYRTMAMGARALLPEAVPFRPEPQPEPQPEPEVPPAAGVPEEKEPAEGPRPPERTPPAATKAERSAPALHGVLGPGLRTSAQGPVLGVDAALGLRVHRYVVVRAGADWQRDQTLQDDAGRDFVRERFALRASALGSVALGRGVFQVGTGIGAGGAALASTTDGASRRHAAGMWRLQASAAWVAADQVFFEVPVALDLWWGPGADGGTPPPLPRTELSLGVRVGFGAP